MTASDPWSLLDWALTNGGKGAGRAVPGAKAECPERVESRPRSRVSSVRFWCLIGPGGHQSLRPQELRDRVPPIRAFPGQSGIFRRCPGDVSGTANIRRISGHLGAGTFLNRGRGPAMVERRSYPRRPAGLQPLLLPEDRKRQPGMPGAVPRRLLRPRDVARGTCCTPGCPGSH